jgi:hypothetical protein
LVTAMDRTVAEVARHADGVGADCAYSRIGAPQGSPKKTVTDRQISDQVIVKGYRSAADLAVLPYWKEVVSTGGAWEVG